MGFITINQTEFPPLYSIYSPPPPPADQYSFSSCDFNIKYDDIGRIQSCFTYRYTVFVMYRFIYENKNIFLFAYSYCTIQFDLKYLLAVL